MPRPASEHVIASSSQGPLGACRIRNVAARTFLRASLRHHRAHRNRPICPARGSLQLQWVFTGWPGTSRPVSRILSDDDHPSEARCCRRAPATYPETSREQRSGGFRGRRTGLLGLAPGGVYRAAPVTRRTGGLLHRRFTLTRPSQPGGLFSVALSRGSPRVGVTHHPALWSPDFPQPGYPGRDHPADSSE